jgi:hypothetical protein
VRDQNTLSGLGERNVVTNVIGHAPSKQIRRPLPQHSIELLDQQGNGRQSGIRGDCRREIRTGKFNQSFGREVSIATAQIALYLDPKAKNVRLMAKQAVRLGLDHRFLRVTKIDVVRTQKQLRPSI